MIKRLFTSLFAGAVLLAGASAEAKTPVITDMPDITVGDNDAWQLTTAKTFVFTDAFNFDSKVKFAGTATVANLKWSFAEAGTAQWYTINGINPAAVGATAMVAYEGSATVKNPTNNLRASAGATFRDIVLSPVGGGSPTPAQITEHAAGKVVRFYVTDGTGVAKRDVIVKSVAGLSSAVLPANRVTFHATKGMNGLLTDPGVGTHALNPTAGWWWANDVNNYGRNGTPGAHAYVAASQAIEIKSGTNEPDTARTQLGYVNATMTENDNNRLKWSDIGANATEASSKIVRAKFWVYAGGQSAAGKPANSVQIPSVRFKLQTGYNVANCLEVLPGQLNWNALVGTAFDAAATAQLAASREIAPSTDPTNPSAYRVDFKPRNAAWIYTNNQQASNDFSFMRQVELYQNMPCMNGSLFLTESWIGTYPASALDITGKTAMATYGAAAMQNFGTSAIYSNIQHNASAGVLNGAANFQAKIYTDMLNANVPVGTVSYDTRVAMTYTAGVGTLLDLRGYTRNVANSSMAVLALDVNTISKTWGTIAAADYVTVPRVARDKMYLVRYTVTTPLTDATKQPGIMFRATVGNIFGQRLEINSWSTGQTALQKAYIASCMPTAADTVYESIVQSPMNSEIKLTQPTWDAAPAFGAANTSLVRAFSVFGITLLNTQSGANADETGAVTLKQVQFFEFNQISD